jgi:hypothetical protein
MNKLVLFAVALITAFGCTKEKIVEVPGPAEPKTIITIDQPVVGSGYHNGDTLFIKGSISAPENVHGYTISIRNKETDVEVYFTHIHDHEANVDIDTHWVCQVMGDCDMILKVDAITDHDGNTAGKEVTFHCSH